jgi:hypothetical protein
MSLLKQIKSRSYALTIVGIGLAAATILTLLISSIFVVSGKDYAIDIQAVKDEQDLFNSARVTVSNVGKLPLTNVIVNYGSGNGTNNINIEKIGQILPGERVWLAPPLTVPFKSVTVTTDQGLIVTKQYTSTFQIPGIRIR